jgi:Flp pilus assembly protein CpaB
MILQNIIVLAVDSGRTEANSEQGGAMSTITLALSPEDTELITAADRAGVLRVALRPVEEENIIASEGTRVTEILRGKFTVTANTGSDATPIIISPPRDNARKEMKIYRGTQESVVPQE